MVERMIGQKQGTGGSLRREIPRGHAGPSLLSRAVGRYAPTSAKERTHERRGNAVTNRARVPLAVSDPGKLHVPRQPLDGRGAAWARATRSRPTGTSGRRKVRRRGNAGCRGSPRLPTASARSSAPLAGSVFLGPNVSVLQAAVATCIDFRGARNEVVYEALQFPSLTYVWREWERYGAAVRIVESPRWPHRADRTNRRGDHGKDRDRGDLARLLCLRRAGRRRVNRKRTAAPSARFCASTRIRRPESIPTTSPRSISTSRPAVPTNGSAAAPAAAGFTSSRRCSRRFARRSPDGWRTQRPFAFEAGADRARGVDVPLRPRHADDPRIRRRGTGSRDDRVRSASRDSRAQRPPDRQDRRDGTRTRAARQLAACRPRTRTGWIGIDFEDSERACRATDRAPRLRRLPARLRHSRRPALLYRRRRNRRLLPGTWSASGKADGLFVDDRRPHPNWRRVPAPFDSGCGSDARRSAARRGRHDRHRKPRDGRARGRDRGEHALPRDRLRNIGLPERHVDRCGAAHRRARRRRLRANRSRRRRRAAGRRRGLLRAKPGRLGPSDPLDDRRPRERARERDLSRAALRVDRPDRDLRHVDRGTGGRRKPAARHSRAARRQPDPHPAAADARPRLVDAPSVRNRRAPASLRCSPKRSRRPTRSSTLPAARTTACLRIARCSWALARRCALLGLPEAIFLLGVIAPDIFIVAMLAPLGRDRRRGISRAQRRLRPDVRRARARCRRYADRHRTAPRRARSGRRALVLRTSAPLLVRRRRRSRASSPRCWPGRWHTCSRSTRASRPSRHCRWRCTWSRCRSRAGR